MFGKLMYDKKEMQRIDKSNLVKIKTNKVVPKINVTNLRNHIDKVGMSIHASAFMFIAPQLLVSSKNVIKIKNKFPSVYELADFVDISKSKMYEVLKELEEKNFIKRVKNNGVLMIHINPNFHYKVNVDDDVFELFGGKLEKETKISKEKKLELELINDLHIIEEGMTLIDNQFKIDGGIIDILARDKENKLCIIELKVIDNDKSIVFQSTYYPTQFDEKVRMITITPNYTKKIFTSLKSLGVEMKTYSIENNELVITDYNYI